MSACPRIITLSLPLLLLLFDGIRIKAADFSPVFPDRGEVVGSYTPELVKRSFAERGMHRVEGIWQLTNGTTVAVERLSENERERMSAIDMYRVVILRASKRSIRPGTIIGYIAPLADAASYEGRFYTDYSRKGLPSRPKKMIVRLDSSDDRLSFDTEKSGWGMSLRQSLPWLFRPTVRYSARGSGRDMYGAVRVYPAPALPLQPVYL